MNLTKATNLYLQGTADSMRKIVASLNQHRRARTTPLSNAEKTARVESELKRDPARSDRAIAEAAGVKSHELVGRIRHRVALDATPSERKSTNGKVAEGQRPDAEPHHLRNQQHLPRRAATHARIATDWPFSTPSSANAPRAATSPTSTRCRRKVLRDRTLTLPGARASRPIGVEVWADRHRTSFRVTQP